MKSSGGNAGADVVADGPIEWRLSNERYGGKTRVFELWIACVQYTRRKQLESFMVERTVKLGRRYRSTGIPASTCQQAHVERQSEVTAVTAPLQVND